MPTWLLLGLSFVGSGIGGVIAFFLALHFMDRIWMPHIREKNAELWKEMQKLAHEFDTLRKTQSLESEWHGLARELAEHDGKAATS